jgi:hypothetical protein
MRLFVVPSLKPKAISNKNSNSNQPCCVFSCRELTFNIFLQGRAVLKHGCKGFGWFKSLMNTGGFFYTLKAIYYLRINSDLFTFGLHGSRSVIICYGSGSFIFFTLFVLSN